jgi:hypothetical protein
MLIVIIPFTAAATAIHRRQPTRMATGTPKVLSETKLSPEEPDVTRPDGAVVRSLPPGE